MTKGIRRKARSLVERGFSIRGALNQIANRLRPHFAVDTRSLAALRIALGIILLLDLFQRASSLELLYTSHGVYPLSVHEATYGQGGGISLHAISDMPWFQRAMLSIAGLFALAFTAGYRTRLVGAVSLLLLVSLHIRNPTILNGGDRLLRVLLFVALLTPLGERWSIDSLRRGSARRSVASVGTVALLAQPLVVFTVNAIEKRRGEHWYAGEALEIALYDSTMATSIGTALLEFPTLLTWLTYGWVALLAGAVPLLLGTTGRARTLAAVAYLAAVVGMALTLSVGLFPLVLAASVTPFVTEAFWNWSTRRVPKRVSERVSSAPVPQSLDSQPIEERIYERLEAYDYGPSTDRVAAVGRSAVVFASVVILLWMLTFAAVDVTGSEPPAPFDSAHLDQQEWGLYAPDPAPSTHWHVTEVKLENGSTIGARNLGVVDFDRPPNARAAYESFRHRSYYQTLDSLTRGTQESPMSSRYTEWTCDRMTEATGVDTERITVYRVQQPKPIGEIVRPSDRVTIVDRSCQ